MTLSPQHPVVVNPKAEAVALPDLKPPSPPLELNQPNTTLRHLTSGAQQIAQRLRTLSSTVGPSAAATEFYTRVRPKTVDSISEKILRKRRGATKPGNEKYKIRDESYSFRDITDAVGMRIVTLYDRNLKDAVGYVVDMIAAGQSLPDPLFKPGFLWNNFHDAVFIKRDRNPLPGDPYVQCYNDVENRIIKACESAKIDVSSIINNDNFSLQVREGDRYSSGHLTFAAIGYVGADRVIIPVEFQIRTAVEDVWAEMSHELIYKAAPKHIWSYQYQTSFNATKKDSSDLKSSIDKLPIMIGQFLESAKKTRNSVDQFWGMISTYVSRFQFSLVASIFFAVGGKETVHFSSYLENYGKAIREVQEVVAPIFSSRTTADELKASKSIIRQALIKSLRKLAVIRKQVDDVYNYEIALARSLEEDSELSDTIHKERLALCDLEMLRLKTFLASYGECQVTDDYQEILYEIPARQHASEIEARDDEKKKKIKQNNLLSLYAGFCGHLDSAHLVRPSCLILFFKYYVAAGLDSPLKEQLTEKNLLESYDALKIDGTIPKWSIYRVLVPRNLAIFYEQQVRQICEQVESEISDGPFSDMRALKGDVQAKLLRGLGYALEAAREYDPESIDKPSRQTEHSGDILFGFDPNGQIVDCKQIVSICEIYNDNFKDMHTHALPEIRASITSHLNTLLRLLGEAPEDPEHATLRERALRVLKCVAGTP